MEFRLQQGNSWVSSIETSIAAYSVRSNDTLRITPKANAYGLDNLYINATDSNGNWIVEPFNYKIEVTAVNDPPQIKKYLGEWKLNEDSKISGIDLNNYFHDPIEPEQTLEFGYEPVDNVEIVLDQLGANVIITPDENWNGEVGIRFSANDGYDTIYNVMRLNVIAVNDPPVFKNPKGFTTNESEWFHRDLVAYDPIEGDSVHIETNITEEVNSQLLRIKRIVTPTIGGVVLGDNLLLETDEKNSSIHHFSFKPSNEMAGGGESSFTGIYYVNFTAVDSGGARVTHNVIMTIMNVNQAPEPKINRPLNESVFYTNDLVYFFGDAGDPDVIHGGHNFYTWSSNLDGELGKLKYVGPIQLKTPGIHTITLEVGDGEQVGRETILLTVREPINITDSSGDTAEDTNTLGLTSTETNLYLMIIALVILVVLSIIAIVLSGMSKRKATKNLKTELAPDQLRLPEEVQKLLAPQKAICGHCGSVLQVVSKHRPLSVMCQECGNKSVIFHPGNAVLEAGAEERTQVPLPAEEPQPMLPPGDEQQ
jgi:hypothetical protein